MTELLSPELLEKIRARAAAHDQSATLCTEDLEDLRQAGYFTAFVPKHLGGGGASLEDIAQAQIALAGAAPATALATNMHQIWMGVARHLDRSGNPAAAQQIWADALAGEIYGFGISEPSNDLVLMRSITEAKADEEGGYRLYGRKIFTTNTGGWTRLGTFGNWAGPEGDRSVFGVICKEDGGFSSLDDWDALGMRASASCSTQLEGAWIRPERVIDVVEPATPAPVLFAIFVTFEILLAATYAGIGKRAIEVAVETVQNRHSVKNDDLYAADPDIRALLARAAMEMDGIWPQITLAARDMDAQVDRGPLWMPQATAIKIRATEAARRTVELCLRACGGRSYFNGHELSRLYRDVLAGIFQPSDQESAQTAWARVLLG